ncbi:MAG TPA: Ig-like domain-containing protein [Acidimicrobiales bacterium]
MTRRLAVALLAVPVALVVTASAAWAYYAAQGSGTGMVAVASLPAPTGVSGIATGATVALTWSGIAAPTGATVGYYVTRTPVPSGVAVDVCGSPMASLASSSVSCTDALAPAGTYDYKVTATAGSWTSTSTPSADVIVGAANTTTALGLSSSTATFGGEDQLYATATVTPQVALTPTGTVVIASGSNVLCTIVLPVTSCSPDPSDLAVSANPYSLTATYSGDGSFNGSTSSPSPLTVYSALNITTTTLAPAWAAETGYSQTLQATGGYGAHTWAVINGLPPLGLLLDSGTGVLSGTFAEGDTSSTFTVAATDTNGAQVTRSFTVVVADPFVTQNSTAPIGDNSTFRVTLANGVAAGHTLVLTVAQACTTTAGTPVDSHVTAVSGDSVTWILGVATGCSAQGDTEIWYGLSSTTGGSTTKITVTLNAAALVQYANVTEYAGITGWDSASGASSSSLGTGAQVSSGASYPSASGELVVAGAYVTRATPSLLTGLVNPFATLNVVSPYQGFGVYAVDSSTAPIGLAYLQTLGGVPSAGVWSAAVTAFALTAP